MEVTNELVDNLVAKVLALDTSKLQKIIAVCGAADLGKSYLSGKLVEALNEKGFSAGHLTLDSFLVPRTQRHSLGISGYDIEAYDLSSEHEQLSLWRKGVPVRYAEYDHQIGATGDQIKTIEPCDFLVLDGLHSMHELFAPLLIFSIFIWTEDDTLRAIRHEADLIKRKQSVPFSLANMESELCKYKQHVLPYRETADVRVELLQMWCFQLSD